MGDGPITSAPDAIEPLLEEVGVVRRSAHELVDEDDVRRAIGRAREIAEDDPAAAAAVHCVSAAIALENAMADELWRPALEAAASTRTSEAAFLLRELGHWPSAGPLGRMAQALFVDLDLSGVPPRPLSEESFRSGMLSGVGAHGDRRLALFYRTGTRRLRSLDLFLHDETGIRDVAFLFEDASETELQLRNPALVWARCDLRLAREVVADAWRLHGIHRTPPPGIFLLYRHFLGLPPIEASGRTPDLSAYRLDRIRPHPDMVERSDELGRHLLHGKLRFTCDEAYRCVRDRLFGEQERSGAHALSRTFLKRFARIVERQERDVLMHRLAANLEVEALLGDAMKPVNRLAALVYVALEQGIVPFEEIPYVRVIAEKSIVEIARVLGDRFADGPEALDLEEEMDRLAADTLEDYETDPGEDR